MDNLKPEDVFLLNKTIGNNISDKKNLIINNKNFIDDSLIAGLPENPNPYLIHYETFEGTSYPIITIPKGLMLFTGRKYLPRNEAESFIHLYKLYNNPNFEDYEKNDFEDTLTYFFPMPIMIQSAISLFFTRVDIVTTTKDIKLLCLMSPSPISRNIHNIEEKDNVKNNEGNIAYNNTELFSCQSRSYDICISKKIIYGLKLNGYIGMPFLDTVTSHKENLQRYFKKNGVKLKDSQLFESCLFNNNISLEPKMNSIIDLMYYQRQFGIPEICLIPYDLHKFAENIQRKEKKYGIAYRLFDKNLSNSNFIVPSENFIFKPFNHFVDDIIGTRKIVNDIEEFLYDSKHLYYKCLQAYPLFNVLINEADENLLQQGMLIPSTSLTNIKSNLFLNAYKNNGVFPYFCAFENMKLYKILQNMIKENPEKIRDMMNISGGNIMTQKQFFKPLQINNQIKQKDSVYLEDILDYKINTTYIQKIIEEDNFFYSERSGIPILYYNYDKEQKAGKKNKTKKYKNKINKKTKKIKTKRIKLTN